MCTGSHGQALDGHHLPDVIIDRERNPIVSSQIGGFLAVPATEEVDRQVLVPVSDSSRLRPTVSPQRCNGHLTMLCQEVEDLVSDGLVHGPIKLSFRRFCHCD